MHLIVSSCPLVGGLRTVLIELLFHYCCRITVALFLKISLEVPGLVGLGIWICSNYQGVEVFRRTLLSLCSCDFLGILLFLLAKLNLCWNLRSRNNSSLFLIKLSLVQILSLILSLLSGFIFLCFICYCSCFFLIFLC